MSLTARDVMNSRFYTLPLQTPIAEAVKFFRRASEEQGQMIFGMMVTDEQGKLVGMISMYDILLIVRPKHIHIWGEMRDMDTTGFLDEACRRAKFIQVGDIMSTDVITITPDTHLLVIVDIMVTKGIRRIPVLEEGHVVGIVYLSTVMYHLMERLIR